MPISPARDESNRPSYSEWGLFPNRKPLWWHPVVEKQQDVPPPPPAPQETTEWVPLNKNLLYPTSIKIFRSGNKVFAVTLNYCGNNGLWVGYPCERSD